MHRISVAARCRIKIGDRYLLIISLNGLKRGERSLAPVGGGVKTTDVGKRYLIDALGADPATFEKGNDLRFRLPKQRIGEFCNWLQRTSELEPDAAAREFRDEIVAERGLLSDRLAQGVTFTRNQLFQGPMRLWSYLGGDTVLVDSYGFEWIYDVTLPPGAERALLRTTEQLEPLAELVTAREIRQGRSSLGSAISDWTKFLL